MDHEITLRYLVKRQNGHIFSEIFTLANIEHGDARRWLEANHAAPDQIHRLLYIGFNDKNGVRVYEGDILTSNIGNCIVEWDSASGQWILRTVENVKIPICCADWADMDKREVIGNIFKDSHLLSKKE